MPAHDIVVVGASAGGVEALIQLVGGLPANLPASLFVVMHMSPESRSMLPAILSRRGHLPASTAQDGEPIRWSHIYVAPPDYHVLIERGVVRLLRGPRENNHRPAVDPLFRSAALAYSNRVIGIVLSGTLDDGTSGLLSIKRRGGLAIVQNPEDAQFDGMPRSALETVNIDYCVPVSEIGPLLVRLSAERVSGEEDSVSEHLQSESDLVQMRKESLRQDEQSGVVAAFTCPECQGSLWESTEDELRRYRCRAGHAFSDDSLLTAQSEALEDALWTALRALEERVALSQRLVRRAEEYGDQAAARRFQMQAEVTEYRAGQIRQVLLRGDGSPVESSDIQANSDIT